MTFIQPTNEQSREVLAKRLTYAACSCWIASLALPGFMVESSASSWSGVVILAFGLLFGWMVNGWAAYANIFFVVAAIALLADRQPRGSVLAMLVLGATLPLFQGVIRDEGSGTVLPVVSWGWGAVIWMCSLVLLAAAAAVRRQQLSSSGAIAVVGLLLIGIAAIGSLLFYQRSAMNSQERALYLSTGMAFTRASPCGIPLVAVDSPLLPPDAIVTLDVDPELVSPKGSRPSLWLPQIRNYQVGDYAWVTLHDPVISNVEVRIRVSASPNRPVLQARKSDRGAILRLLSGPSGQVLYQQELKVTSTVAGNPSYCPMSTQFGFRGLESGYDTVLLQALGQESTTPKHEKLIGEIARNRCSLSEDDNDEVKGLREWDGRKVILEPESIRSRVGFCSESYIVLTYISEYSATGISDLSPVAQVFDRKTLRPLAVFNDGRQCPRARCPEAPREIVSGARISDKEVIVETTAGDLIAKRR